jgi:hypothetical protein
LVAVGGGTLAVAGDCGSAGDRVGCGGVIVVLAAIAGVAAANRSWALIGSSGRASDVVAALVSPMDVQICAGWHVLTLDLGMMKPCAHADSASFRWCWPAP